MGSIPTLDGERRPAGADSRLDAAARPRSRPAAHSIRAVRAPSRPARRSGPSSQPASALAGRLLALPPVPVTPSRRMSALTQPRRRRRRAAPLVEVENLGRIFDVSKPWLNRVIERPAAPAAGRGRGRDLHHRPARDLRAGRRIRLRQVDGRQDDGRPDAADHRRGRDRRRLDEQSEAGRRPPPAAPPHPDDVPGPLRQPQSALARARHRRRADPRLRHRAERATQIAAEVGELLQAGRPRSGRRRQVSARVLRRPAPAHRDRARARLASRNSSCATSRPRRSTCRCRRRSST